MKTGLGLKTVPEVCPEFAKAPIEVNKIKVSPESQVLGHSFRSMSPDDMAALKQHYPADFARVTAAFPLIGASAMVPRSPGIKREGAFWQCPNNKARNFFTPFGIYAKRSSSILFTLTNGHCSMFIREGEWAG